MNFFNLNPNRIYPRMTRDFLLEFESITDTIKAEEALNKVNKINNFEVFEIDNRGKSLFLTFKFDKELNENSFILNQNNEKVMLYKKISFVALKNGMHDEKGFIFASEKIRLNVIKKSNHVKNIHDEIINYFNE